MELQSRSYLLHTSAISATSAAQSQAAKGKICQFSPLQEYQKQTSIKKT
jgi:hypothetical protein